MATAARLEELKKKFEENPRRYFAPFANEHRKLGDLGQAIAICRAHLPQQPGHISGHIVLAQALHESQELGEARQVFEQALELDPENLIALRSLGDIARAMGDAMTARSWYQRVLESDPRNDEIADLLRELHQRSADGPDGATEEQGDLVTGAEEEPIAVDAESSLAESEDKDRTPVHSIAVTEEPPSFRRDSGERARAEEDFFEEYATFDQASELVEDASAEETPAATQGAAEESPVEAEHPSEEAEVRARDGGVGPKLDKEAFVPGEEAFAAPSLHDLGELEAVAEPSMDDWFAPEPKRAAPAPAEPEHGAADEPDRDDAPTFPALAFQPPAEQAQASSYVSWEPVSADETSADAEAAPTEEAYDGFMPSALEATASASEAKGETMEPAVSDSPFVSEPQSREETPAPVIAEYDEASMSSVGEGSDAPHQDHRVGFSRPPAPPPIAGLLSYESHGERDPDALHPAAADAQNLADARLRDATRFRHDPLVGRTPAFGVDAIEATPAAFVTETMAELYLQQGFIAEAIAVYRELLAQHPHDVALRDRLAALEGGSPSPAIPEPPAAPAPLDAEGHSVRSFFGRLARRQPPPRAPRADVPPPDGSALDTSGLEARFAQRGSADASASPSLSLDDLFAKPSTTQSDAQAAAHLASAFAPVQNPKTPRGSNSELSLDHLFGDVPPGRPGTPMLDEFFAVPPDGEAGTTRRPESDDADEARAADIEQFNAWLEGLKKK